MEAFVRHRGIAAPFLMQNVDTDVIIPIMRLISIRPGELGRYCFESIRYTADGSDDPAFILNREPYRRASILLAGPNFGCGSSREGAVTALMGMGFRCVIAPSFGDIFFNNCFKNGMLPIVLDEESIRGLAERAEKDAPSEFDIDLEQCTVTPQDADALEFTIEPQRREKLLKGLDDIQETLQFMDDIAAFQKRDRVKRPWIYEWAEDDA